MSVTRTERMRGMLQRGPRELLIDEGNVLHFECIGGFVALRIVKIPRAKITLGRCSVYLVHPSTHLAKNQNKINFKRHYKKVLI